MKFCFKTILAAMLMAFFICSAIADETPVQVKTQTLINDTDILAEFDGGVITRGELLEKINKLQPQVQGRYKTADGQKQVLDIMATEALFMQKAIELGINNDPEVLSKIRNGEKQFYVQEYYRRNISQMTLITEEMKQQYYNENKQVYFVAPNITIEYIQCGSEALANKAIQMLNSGMSFPSVSDSLNINSYVRGLRGTLKNIRLNGNIPGVGNDPALEQLIANAEVSGTTIIGPQQTATGWSIFRKVEMIPAYQKTFDEVYDELEQRIRPTAEKNNLNDLLTRLKQKYNVTINSAKLDSINLRTPDVHLGERDMVIVDSSNPELRLTINDIITAFTKISPQEQLFYVKGQGAAQLVEQELTRNLLYVEAKAQNYLQYFENNAEYIQMKRFHILSTAFNRLVREQATVSPDDLLNYYNQNQSSYTTPAKRDIEILWFDNMDKANKAWRLYGQALRRNNERKMQKIIKKYSLQPERKLLENQYNNGTVTGIGPDPEFSRLIWATGVNGLSPVFTTQRGEIVFFRVLREHAPVVTPYADVEQRIQGNVRQLKERQKQDEVIQTLSVEYNLRKFPERISLMLSASELFELANGAAQQRNYNDAIVYYDQIIQNYQNNVDDYKATFMKAFLVSEEMNDKPRALQIFRHFLQKFPAGDLHESAQFMVDVIEGRVSPDFEVQSFETE